MIAVNLLGEETGEFDPPKTFTKRHHLSKYDFGWFLFF